MSCQSVRSSQLVSVHFIMKQEIRMNTLLSNDTMSISHSLPYCSDCVRSLFSMIMVASYGTSTLKSIALIIGIAFVMLTLLTSTDQDELI